jgi:hypothetical protein
MKPALTAGLVASALFAQQAAATGWIDQPIFPNLLNTNNKCTVDQNKGFDWSKLPIGGFNNFDGFNFGGFDCKDSFQPKNRRRSLETRTIFQVSRETSVPNVFGGLVLTKWTVEMHSRHYSQRRWQWSNDLLRTRQQVFNHPL